MLARRTSKGGPRTCRGAWHYGDMLAACLPEMVTHEAGLCRQEKSAFDETSRLIGWGCLLLLTSTALLTCRLSPLQRVCAWVFNHGRGGFLPSGGCTAAACRHPMPVQPRLVGAHHAKDSAVRLRRCTRMRERRSTTWHPLCLNCCCAPVVALLLETAAAAEAAAMLAAASLQRRSQRQLRQGSNSALLALPYRMWVQPLPQRCWVSTRA